MTIRKIVVSVTVAGALGLSAVSARALDLQTCQPGLVQAVGGPHSAQYIALIEALAPVGVAMTYQLAVVTDQASYETLLASANDLAASIATGRMVITVPDGTVVLDTAREDNTTDPTSNSYQHFLDKTINENHNSRVAIFAAQQYPCGVGFESRASTTGTNEASLAVRAGSHLDNVGTLRLSSQE